MAVSGVMDLRIGGFGETDVPVVIAGEGRISVARAGA
jgi:hypothetical protein